MEDHSHLNTSEGLNIVSIGGGNGLSTLLTGLKEFVGAGTKGSVWVNDLSAVVAVTDDGGSSGRLRDELKMPPPGDIRNCLVALSEDSHLLSRLFRYRFRGDGELGGHSFGNLFLAALSEITGDFSEAVRLSSEILVSKGHIYPATTDDVRLTAVLENGEVVRGETNIGKIGNRIRKLSLEPESCEPMPETLEAIRKADLITVGPGSLFTSLLPPILVTDVANEIASSNAEKVLICNLMTQPGETGGFSALDHLDVIRKYAPGIDFDFLVINDRPIENKQAEKYGGKGASQIGIGGSISPETVKGVEIIYDNLLDKGEKVRHNTEKLARIVLRCAFGRAGPGGQSAKLRRPVAS